MLSIINEIDSCLLLPLCVLYEIQNQIFQQAYDSPLVSFDGKVVIPKGYIRLPVQAGSKVVEVDFIVVDASSPYTAIVARPWLHVLGAVSSTLYLKVKYPFGEQVEELVRSQSMTRQCLVAAIMHLPEVEFSTSVDVSS